MRRNRTQILTAQQHRRWTAQKWFSCCSPKGLKMLPCRNENILITPVLTLFRSHSYLLRLWNHVSHYTCKESNPQAAESPSEVTYWHTLTGSLVLSIWYETQLQARETKNPLISRYLIVLWYSPEIQNIKHKNRIWACSLHLSSTLAIVRGTSYALTTTVSHSFLNRHFPKFFFWLKSV